MSKYVYRYPMPPVVCDAKGDVTNIVYDDSGLGIAKIEPAAAPLPDDALGDKGPISETVSTSVRGS